MISLSSKAFRPWRRPGRFVAFLQQLLLAASVRAEEPRIHRRASQPMLAHHDIREVLQVLEHWIGCEQMETIAYQDQVAAQPGQASWCWRLHRQECAELEANARRKLDILLRIAALRQGCRIQEKDRLAFFEHALHYKNWAVRAVLPAFTGSSTAPLHRAKWCFVELMATWSRV